MKKTLVILISLSMFIALPNIAGAAPITLIDTTYFTSTGTNATEDLNSYGGQYVNELEYVTDWVYWTHHFDFSPTASEILSGTLVLSLVDDESDVWNNPFTWELGFGYAEDGNWDIFGVNTADYSYNVNGSYLADGTFSVLLASVGGDFSIFSSELTIEYTTAPVPEPATMLLLGTGLLGLVAVGRKRFQK